MKFSKYFALSLSCLTLWSAHISAEDVKPWAQNASDIAPEAGVTYGTLPNGMRYILMPNQQPPGRVSMRLHIDAGSLMEREDQRGVAHFLEHMVFNGSKNFPDATKLIPKMQRLGIAFGAHANAYTSFDETVYMLDLPNNEADTLKLGFDIMRDFGDGAFLREEEIEKERGVILSEKTSRDSVQRRLMEEQFKALLPDSLIAERFPIGTEEIIKTAPRSAFTDFYSEYYIPSKMTFVYVGDFDAKAAEKRIIDTFSSMKNPEKVGADPKLGSIPSGQGFQTLVLADKEVDTTDLTLIAMKPFVKKPDTKATRAEKMPLNIANSILTNRLSILANKEDAPFASGYAFKYGLFKFSEIGGITLNAKDHDWKSALPVLEQELRRAVLYGFTESEFNEVKANLINDYEHAVKSTESRKTNDLASSLARHIHSNSVFSSAEEDLAILNAHLENLTPAKCHEAFKKFWDTEDITLTLTTNKSKEDEDMALLSNAYKTSQSVTVTKPEEKELEPFAYTDFGPMGKIKEQIEIKDLDISQMHFHNGCKCNVKKTDFDKNLISIKARVGGGRLTMPLDKPALDRLATAVVNKGGVGKHSEDDLKRILAGRNAYIEFQVTDDAFTLTGTTTPDDLELQLQLLCAYLTDPGLRPEAERAFDAQLPGVYSQMKYTAAGAQSKMRAFLRGDDPRFVFPEKDELEKLNTEDVREWVVPSLQNDYLELSIVGDINEETLIPILNKTVGALPERSATKSTYTDERLLKNLPTTGVEKRYTFESKVPTGSAMVIWKTTGLDKDNISDVRRLGVLGTILSNRMREKIREELGEAYSPYAGSQPDDTFNLGFMLAVSPGKPEQAEPIGKLIIEIANELADKGATQDELDRAVAPILSSLQQSLRQNDYWLNTVIARSQEQPHRLDWARSRSEDYSSVKLEEVNKLAKKYLSKENTYRFEIVPVPAED